VLLRVSVVTPWRIARDDLVDVWPDEVGAENAIGLLFNKHLEAIDGLGDAPRGVPVRGLPMMRPELKTLLARLLLADADGRDRRDREGEVMKVFGVG
jgi:hypothetical protein